MNTVYYKWEDVPKGLLTRTQLRTEGLKPAPNQEPVAYKQSREQYALYDKEVATPIRKMSQAQKVAARQNIAKARQALCCIDCGQQMQVKRELIQGRCVACHQKNRIEQDRGRARQTFVDLASSSDWLVLDTETTGLETDDEVISVAVVTATGEVLFNERVRPTQRIQPGASAVHGITNDMLADVAAFTEVYPRLSEVLAGWRILAYNAEFDHRMLRQTCERYGLPAIEVKWDCVMELYAAAYNRWSNQVGFVWCTLGDACFREGVSVDGFHTACADAQATRLLVLAVAGKESSCCELQENAAA